MTAIPTNSALAQFAQFAKTPTDHRAVARDARAAVVYTRVSSKEQADKNLSLDFQRKAIEEYAGRNGFTIAASFGGTYESAKSDGRKEFARMLDFVKKSRGSVSHILVYTLDRFSRTGGGAIKLAEELREKYGVTVFAVTQPADTSNPSGVLQQSIHFIFSQYDNQLRKQRAVAGMKEKFNQGIWCVKPPMGYDIIRSNGVRKIVLNATGKKLRKAFEWKAQGMKNEAIVDRLVAMGVPMYRQKLALTLANPFYCGLMSHGMLEGRIVEGVHEKLVSQELFLAANNPKFKAVQYGVPHKKELNEVPLKVFVRCSDCNQPFTGYVVKAKNLWYYKCRTIGCKCNSSAVELHHLFESLLGDYSIKEFLMAPLQYQMEAVWADMNKESFDMEASLKQQLADVEKKLDAVEEKYFVTGEMSKEIYEKFSFRYRGERDNITRELSSCGQTISNPKATIAKALDISLKLATAWTSSDVAGKEKLQKLVFPEGIIYDKQKQAFRTTRVNTVFAAIASLARVSGDCKNKQPTKNGGLSCSVGTTRFELATPCTPCKEI